MDETRSRRRKEIKLDTGKIVGYRLPWIADCLMLGDIPLPAIEEVAKLRASGKVDETKEQQASLELSAFQATRRFHDALVMQMVLDVDGADVSFTDPSELRDWFEEEEFATLRDVATRTKDPDSGEA